MITNIKYRLVKFLEKIPLIQLLVYNNLEYFKFLFPHDKDYKAIKLLFNFNETRSFLDVGGNIGLSTIGFRELGFKKNKILIFEPDKYLYNNFLKKLKKNYKKIKIYNFGLSNKDQNKFLYQVFYNKLFLHFNNSFSFKYIKEKIKNNYPTKYKKFIYKKKKFKLKKFDGLNIKNNICFVKIDVEGFDHLVIRGMRKLIKNSCPVFLIEFNKSNFNIIHNFLKPKYFCYKYMLDTNKLLKLNQSQIRMMHANTLDIKFKKNSFNVFFIPKEFFKQFD